MNGPDDTNYDWTDDDPFTGLSFPLYKFERNRDLSCSTFNDTCKANCDYVGGLYNDDEAVCYQMHALKKVCVKIDMNYYDNLLHEDAEIVSGVQVTVGCYAEGEAGIYAPVSLKQNTKTGTVISFTDVAVEVRDTHDPYTVFAGINRKESTDLSIFFWMSMMCLAASVVLIFYLTFYYYCFIARSAKKSEDGGRDGDAMAAE